MLKKNQKKGFTLIELMLYVGIISTVVFISSVFLIMLLQSREKNQTISEIEENGVQIMETITQTIRNSEGINSPSSGSSSGSLSLGMTDGSKDPTIFDLSGSTIRITEGSGSSVPLSSSRVELTGLSFKNLSRPNTPGNITVQFTMTHFNPGSRNEFEWSKTFYGSASLR